MPALPPRNDAAVTALYGNHHGWLHAWLRRRMDHAGDAADLAHDTFLRVFTRHDLAAPCDPPTVREPRAYLGAIARGLVADFFRREDVSAHISTRWPPCPTSTSRRRKHAPSTPCSTASSRPCARRSCQPFMRAATR